jgi:hypothetical protein
MLVFKVKFNSWDCRIIFPGNGKANFPGIHKRKGTGKSAKEALLWCTVHFHGSVILPPSSIQGVPLPILSCWVSRPSVKLIKVSRELKYGRCV